MAYEKFGAHSNTYIRVHVFDIYKKDQRKYMARKKIEDIGISPDKVCNFVELPCCIRFDIMGETVEAVETLSTLFPNHFVIACECWETFKIKAAINGKESDDYAYRFEQSYAVGGIEGKPEFATGDIHLMYRRLVIGTVTLPYLAYDEIVKINEDGERREKKMMQIRKKRLWE